MKIPNNPKETKTEIRNHEEYLESIIDTIREALLILDKDFRVISANQTFYERFKVNPKQTENKMVFELGNGQWNIPELRILLEEILPTHNPFNDFRVEYKFPHIGRKVMLLNARQIKARGKWKDRILLAIEDVTEFDKDRLEKEQGIERERIISEELKRSEIKFHTLTALAPVGIFMTDPDGNCLYVNKKWQQIAGLNLKEAQGKGWSKSIHPDDKKRVSKEWYSAAKNKREFQSEYRFQTPEGKVTWVEGKAIAYEVGNKVAGFIGTITDITARKVAEESLKNSEKSFRTLIEKSTDAIHLVNIEGKIIYSSDSVRNVTGYSSEELIGKNVFSFIHPQDLIFFQKKFKEVLSLPNKTVYLQCRVKHKDGSWAWIEITGVNHLKTPNINALVGTFRNITNQKVDEEKLRENEARLQLALDAGEIGVWDWDIINNQIKWTDKVYEIHEVDKKEFDGEFVNYITRVHPSDKDFVENAIKKALKNEAPYNIEFRIITKKGNVKWISTSAKVIFENGNPVRMLGATKDVTSRKELERQKDEFLGIASHELKTPVTSIKAYGQVLQTVFRRKGDIASVEKLEKMDSQVNKLTNLIGDLLDVTKIQSGRLEFQEDYFDVNELLNEVVDEMQLTTERHKLVKKLDRSKSIFGDKERIGQVLTNLITNAIKYSPHTTKIIIRSEIDKEAVIVSVQDFGVGIPKEKQEKVFEQFYRVSGPNHNTVPGLGLGLYISSEIVKRQGGKIWVLSKEGKGTKFLFSLPVKRKKTKKKNKLAEEDIKHD